MNLEEFFKKEIEDRKDDFAFRLEALILEITEQISRYMKERNISRVKLAKLLGVSPPAVTKILNGNSNFTLKTLLALANAIGIEMRIEFKTRRPNLRILEPAEGGKYAAAGESSDSPALSQFAPTSYPTDPARAKKQERHRDLAA